MGRLDWMIPRRVSEATPQMRAATGAIGHGGGWDPVDGTSDWRRLGDGGGPREVPSRTLEQARVDSIAGHRANPMARAIVETYVAFCVGDSGLTMSCTSDDVRPHAEQFWTDPRNRLVSGQELMFRTAMLFGELLNEMMVGGFTGVARRSPIDPTRIRRVELFAGNPLWPELVVLANGPGMDDTEMTVVQIDDLSELRTGQVMFEPYFRATEFDTRGTPLLMPVLDWLDSYDTVLSNLIDRTALARFIAMDVTLKGENADVDEFVKARGGRQIPRSGTIEVHNDSVEWKPLQTSTGAYEDAKTNTSVLTNIAAGGGLSKVWLAEPEDANRATSLTMAEPVRRRLGSVQNEYVAYRQEMVRFQIDRKVAAGTIPRMVTVKGPGGEPVEVPAASTVSITGPQIAAADAQVTAKVLAELSAGITELMAAGVLSKEAAAEAAEKAWTDYVGVPYRAELDAPDGDQGDLATHVEDSGGATGALASLMQS